MKLFLGLYSLFIFLFSTLLPQKSREESVADGAEIYNDFCVQCHLGNGVGVAGVFPPLNKSDYLFEDINRSIAGIKYGLKGPIEVNGTSYNGVMVNQGLDAQEIADVMNYILNSWDNQSEQTVTSDWVEKIEKP